MMNNLSQGLGSFNNMMPQNNMGQQNPYGQQMNPQMMGQQMRSPEMFSEQLMEPNQMNPMQDPMQGLQPMAEPEGFGVYGQSLEGFADGGEAVPRETEIMGQPHMLAYINPEEEMMLRQMGGSGDPGPGGVPSYNFFTDLFSGPSPAQQEEDRSGIDPNRDAVGIKERFNQVISDVKEGIGQLQGKPTSQGFKERSAVSSAYAEEVEKARQKDDDKAARSAAAAPATTATGTGIDTLPTGSPTGAGTVGTTYEAAYGGFMPSSDFDATTGEIFGSGNTYGAMTDGSQLIKILGPGGVIEYQILDPSGSSITRTYDNFQDAYQFANSKSVGGPPNDPTFLPDPVTGFPYPIFTPDPIVAPIQPVPEPINTQVPAATVDPMTPVGGDFLLPGQQNYGPTPAAALNFNPNTYMQTPQNASVVLPDMFQKGNAYTFEELLSQYKPAYEPIL